MEATSIYAKAEVPVRISVPVHGDTPLKRGLQRHLMNPTCSRALLRCGRKTAIHGETKITQDRRNPAARGRIAEEYPTAEYQAVMAEDDRNPIEVAYERRNRDLDPQLVWRGKDEQNGSDLVVQAPPLFIQEKVHPKVLIDDLRQRSKEKGDGESSFQD